jgi:nicotinamidase-related amidase
MKTEMYCYLEDRDRKVLPETPAFEKWLDPAQTAVLCIDMHRGHIGPEEQLTCDAPRARERIPHHDVFHAACRDIGMPVIMVQHWQRHGGADDITAKDLDGGANWRHIYPLYWPPSPLMDEHSWEGTKWLDLLVEHDPERDYYIRTKKRLSAFYPTDLEFLLRRLNVRNVVITGTMTDACDLSTAFDAANLDFRVIMPRDIVAGYSEAAEHGALMIVSLHLGLVVDAPALVREWYAREGREVPEALRDAQTMDDAVGERLAASGT